MSALRPPRRGLSRAPPALPARTSHRDRVHATTHPVRQHACPRATHTPAVCRRSGLHMARHMKAASCRLLRSHAAVDGTPHRLMVPHTPPRPPWAAPRPREEANVNNMLAQLRNRVCGKIALGNAVLHPQVDDDSATALRRPAHAHTPRPLASHMHHQSRSLPGRFCTRRRRFSGQTMRGRTTWTSAATTAAWRDVVTVLGSSDHRHGPRRNAAARRLHADLRPAGAG